MCHALRVSKSGFYDWRRRRTAPPTPTEKSRQERRAAVEQVFNESRAIYGYRKIHAVLRKREISCSPNTVHADCKRAGIKSVTKKKFRMFRNALNVTGISQSASRRGDYVTCEEAKTSIIEYIEMFYNSRRVHQSLDYRTPNEFEAETESGSAEEQHGEG